MATTANAPKPPGPPQIPSLTDHASLLPHEGMIPPVDLLFDEMSTKLVAAPSHPLPDIALDFAPSLLPPVATEDLDSLPGPSMSSVGLQAAQDADTTLSTQAAASVKTDLESYAAEEAAVPDRHPVEAFAKLQFPDGDFYVSTSAVILGRDMEAMKQERRMKRSERKRKQAGHGDALDDTEEPLKATPLNKAMQGYAASASNMSEAGGIIAMPMYSGDEDTAKQLRRRRRRGLTSNGSSHSQTQSIAPANLHNNPALHMDASLLDDAASMSSKYRDVPIIPIHPPADGSCSGISREHVRIQYNSEKSHWELHVLGRNGAWVDGGDILQKDSVVRLRHGSVIQIQSVDIIFKLPDNVRGEEPEPESATSDSELSGLDSSLEDDKLGLDDSGATSDQDEKVPRERVKLKLSLSKRGQQLAGKTVKSSKTPAKPSKDEKKEKEKEQVKEKEKDRPKKPKKEETDETDIRPSIEDATPEVKPKQETPGVPAVPAADLPPGSILAGLAPEEIPQKRKGPGRPPKNGVMSKRDEAIIKRKKKELQKMGREIPPLAELLAMARAEAGSTKKTDDPNGDGEAGAGNGANDEAGGASAEGSSKPQTAADIEAAKARKTAKSPSPQKPESEYTEEELKKPSKTYVVLIHDALSASTSGIMDLQQIYDAIQKMYPFYKYRSTTQGWQSSIRHNLIGSEAFEEAGKIGKGRLWKINPNYPIDKEKKRRAPTPPTDKPSYPYFQNGQYSNQGYPPYRPSPYGTPYGPPTNPPNGARPPPSFGQQQQRGTYYSPYAANPPGQTPYANHGRPPAYQQGNAPNQAPAAANAAGPAGLNAQSPAPAQGGSQVPANASQAPRPGAPPAPAQAAPVSNDDTIEEIMAYHKKYLGKYKLGPEQDAARDLFRRAVSRHIDHNKVHGPYTSAEEKKVADVIGEIIRRNKAKQKPPVTTTSAQPPQRGTPSDTQSPASQVGTPAPRPVQQPAPAPPPPAAANRPSAPPPLQHQQQQRQQQPTIDLTGPAAPTQSATPQPVPAVNAGSRPPPQQQQQQQAQGVAPPQGQGPPPAAAVAAPVPAPTAGVGAKRAAEEGGGGPDAKKVRP